MYRRLAKRARLNLDPFSCWMLLRLGQIQPSSSLQLAQRLNTPLPRLQPALDALIAKGFVHNEVPSLTRAGAGAYALLIEARRKGLEALLEGWPPGQQLEMASTLRALAERFLSDDFGKDLEASKSRMRAATRTA